MSRTPIPLPAASFAALFAAALCLAVPQDLGAQPAPQTPAATGSAALPTVDRIAWLMPEVDAGAPAPAGSTTGSPIRRGLAQPIADYLIANWGTRTKHEVLIANVKRSWRMIENGEQACHLGVLRTPEREAVAYFFDTHLIPPHQLIVRRASLAKLPRLPDGDVDLERLWAEKPLRGAVVAGRSYGRALDAQLAKRPAGVVEEYTTPDFGGNMLSMIAIGRADYTIEYDFVLSGQQEQRASGAGRVSTADLVSVPIEGFAEPVVSGVACPKTEWGRRATAQVERVLSTPQARQFMRDEFLSHLSAEAKARYGPRIDAFYAKPTR